MHESRTEYVTEWAVISRWRRLKGKYKSHCWYPVKLSMCYMHWEWTKLLEEGKRFFCLERALGGSDGHDSLAQWYILGPLESVFDMTC